jgi:hypothetical protein
MTTIDNDSLVKISTDFKCNICNYNTGRKYNLDIHLNSIKHKNNVSTTNHNEPLVIVSKNYSCQNCAKEFNDRAGLWRHKKKCSVVEPHEESCVKNNTSDKDELITYLMKENQEFKNLILEIVKKDTNNTINNTTNNNTTNSHNKAFNLNFFLNETCKDAMNIMDFVDSIKLQLSDLEKVGELGYVEGISNIIVKNLNELDVTQRPVHCTDKKRETMYIKDEDKWEKDESNSKIKKAIKRVASKNQRLLPKFKEAHPDCGTYHSKYSDQYNKIIIESVGGSGDNDAEKEEKIIRNISKNVMVEK